LGCNKEDDKNPPTSTPTGQYYIKFKVDGVWQEMKTQNTLMGIIGQSGDQHAMAIDGYSQGGANTNILVMDDKEITTGVYSDFEIFPTFQRGVIIAWTNENGYTFNTTYQNKLGSVNITSITSSEIRGTFSGELIDLVSQDEVTVTEGEFFVKRVY